MEERAERRLSAILAADVVGYSRLVEADEAATLAAFKGHLDQLIGPAIADNRGRIVKTMGDGVLAEFQSAADTRLSGRRRRRRRRGRRPETTLAHTGDRRVRSRHHRCERRRVVAALAAGRGACLNRPNGVQAS